MNDSTAQNLARTRKRTGGNPILEGELGARAARTLSVIFRTLLVILPVLLIASWPLFPMRENLALAALLIVVITLYFMNTSGRLVATIYGLLGALIVFGIASTLAYGSIRGMGVFAFVGAVVIGGIYLGRGALLGVVGVNSAAIGALIYAESTGSLPKPEYSVGLVHVIIHAAVLGAIALVVFYSRNLAVEAQLRTRESEERLAKLLRSNPAALLITRLEDGQVLDLNPASARVFGITRDDAIGKTAVSLRLWKDQAERASFLARARREGRIENMQATMQRRNGEAFEALLSAELLEGGDSPELLTTVTDISELERARSALRTSEERFKSAFRLSPIGMTIARQTDGVFLEVNDANVKTLGYARDELIGKSGIELGIWPSPEERHLLTEKLVSAGAVAAYETRLKNRAGGLVDASFWATLIEFDGVPCVLASVLNITEQKREETLILDVARGVSGETGAPFFRSLVEHLGHALKADIVIVGEILGNAQVRTLALLRDATILPNIAYPLKGTPCETLAGQRSTTLYLDRVAEKFPEFGMLAETGMRGYMGLSLRDPDGSPIGVLNLLSRSPIEMSERSEALFRIFAARAQSELLRMRRDREIQTLNVSLERRVAKRTAQLESANQELEAFSYSVSHDLRAPLRAIDGFVRVLAGPEASSDEALREKAQERVIGSVKRMNSLIEDMIGLAQVSSQVIHHARVDLGMLAREVGESLRERNPGREVDLRVLAGPSVQCDRDLMRIVLENLLGNAWKFTGKRAQAKIEFGSEDLSGGQAAFYVRDNGAGFDPEYAHKLFSPFQRLHGAKEFDGTGIGLATVKRIIARHGGRVWALSEPDKGATFYFTCSVA